MLVKKIPVDIDYDSGLVCIKLSNCETRAYPRDTEYCRYLKTLAAETGELPATMKEADGDCANVYALMPMPPRRERRHSRGLKTVGWWAGNGK